jgi:hypothetical protein
MPSSKVQVDDANWPLVLTTFDGQQSDDDVEYYMRRMDGIHARGEPFVALTILRSYSNNLSHLKRLGGWAKARSNRPAESCKGSAIVLPSTAARFLISSFLLLFVPPFPMVSFDDLPAAVAWLKRQLVAVGLPIPATLESLGGEAVRIASP